MKYKHFLKAGWQNANDLHNHHILRVSFGHWLLIFQSTGKEHRFFDDVMHLASLIHATACMVLRRDKNFDNLIDFNKDDHKCNPPVGDVELDVEDFDLLHGPCWSV